MLDAAAARVELSEKEAQLLLRIPYRRTSGFFSGYDVDFVAEYSGSDGNEEGDGLGAGFEVGRKLPDRELRLEAVQYVGNGRYVLTYNGERVNWHVGQELDSNTSLCLCYHTPSWGISAGRKTSGNKLWSYSNFLTDDTGAGMVLNYNIDTGKLEWWCLAGIGNPSQDILGEDSQDFLNSLIGDPGLDLRAPGLNVFKGGDFVVEFRGDNENRTVRYSILPGVRLPVFGGYAGLGIGADVGENTSLALGASFEREISIAGQAVYTGFFVDFRPETDRSGVYFKSGIEW